MRGLDTKTFLKSISPKIVAKAIQAFDRATVIVVGSCWAGAILMVGFALYTVNMSVASKRAADEALVAEPSLPKIVRKNADGHDVQVMIQRLQEHYPGITFAVQSNQGLSISAADGNKFRDWMTALSYVDAISPQFHWTLQEFCVGKCGGHDLMRALLVGVKVSFEAPGDTKK